MHRAALHSLRQVICSSPIPHSPRPSRIFPARNRVFASIAAPHPEPPALELIAVTPLATELLAHYFASSLQPGDSYLLYGEVGSGKSYFRYVRFVPCHVSFLFSLALTHAPTAPTNNQINQTTVVLLFERL